MIFRYVIKTKTELFISGGVGVQVDFIRRFLAVIRYKLQRGMYLMEVEETCYGVYLTNLIQRHEKSETQ